MEHDTAGRSVEGSTWKEPRGSCERVGCDILECGLASGVLVPDYEWLVGCGFSRRSLTMGGGDGRWVERKKMYIAGQGLGAWQGCVETSAPEGVKTI